MKHEYDIPELYAIYLETRELVRNRPDAVCTHYKARGKSIFQRKLANIKRYAANMTASNPEEQRQLNAILGRKVETNNSKFEWYELPRGV